MAPSDRGGRDTSTELRNPGSEGDADASRATAGTDGERHEPSGRSAEESAAAESGGPMNRPRSRSPPGQAHVSKSEKHVHFNDCVQICEDDAPILMVGVTDVVEIFECGPKGCPQSA